MTAVVVRGDAGRLPLPAGSVDLIVCSPPYFGLRSYADGGEHYDGQIGSEGTPGEYLEALWACTAEWLRVLRPGGSIFVNLGDKYSGAQQQSDGPMLKARSSSVSSAEHYRRMKPENTGIPAKSLMGLPWRYAIGCVDRLGLILRAEIVWSKPNGLPESVQDRVRRSHEQVFHFTVRPRYFAAVDEIREPQDTLGERHGSSKGHRALTLGFTDQPRALHPLGKLPGSVWSIPSAPLVVPEWVGVDHFAAFPPELVRRVVLGWSPAGVCTGCGEGRRPVTDKALDLDHVQRQFRPGFIDGTEPGGNLRGLNAAVRPNGRTVATITGYACDCPVPDAPARPAVVVDPFGGTGTTALVASVLGRVGVTVDMSGDYCRLAAWRVADPGERARALGVAKPPPVPDGQGSLFDDVEAS